jgi:hypothetical protein
METQALGHTRPMCRVEDATSTASNAVLPSKLPGRAGSSIEARRRGPSTRRLRNLCVSLGLGSILAGLSASPALSWGWYGWLTHSANGYCNWYSSSGECTGMGTNWSWTSDQNSGPDTMHMGFENGNAIRGWYLSAAASAWFPESSAFASGAYVQAEATCGDPAGTCPYGSYDVHVNPMQAG